MRRGKTALTTSIIERINKYIIIKLSYKVINVSMAYCIAGYIVKTNGPI